MINIVYSEFTFKRDYEVRIGLEKTHQIVTIFPLKLKTCPIKRANGYFFTRTRSKESPLDFAMSLRPKGASSIPSSTPKMPSVFKPGEVPSSGTGLTEKGHMGENSKKQLIFKK